MNYFSFVRALRFGIAEDRAPWRSELHPRGFGGRFARTAVRLYQIDKSKFAPTTTRAQIVEMGKRSVADEFGIDYNPSEVLEVPMDGGVKVQIATKGILHGIRPYNAKTFSQIKPNQRYNAYIMSIFGKIVKQSVLLKKEAALHKERGESTSSLYVSACRDGDSLVPVVIRVNGKGAGTGGEISDVFVLHSLNSKKTERNHAISDLGFTAPADSVPTISLPQLLAICQSCFSDFYNS